MSQLQLKLLRTFNDFDEGGEVSYNNEVKVYIRDEDVNSLLIYDGYISGYAPVIEGTREYILITLLPYSTQFSRYILRDGAGNTEIAFASQDPSTILKTILDYYVVDGGKVDYEWAVTLEKTNTAVTYTFNTQMVLEAVEKCRQLSPDGWYWYVNADNKLYFREKSDDAEHYFQLDGNILEIKSEKRVENLVNRVYFTGGGTPQLYRVYSRAGSITSYGLYGHRITDRRVTVVATAQTMADGILDAHDTPESRFIIKVADSNGSVSGYDIESIDPGDTCKILNYADKDYTRWDIDTWDEDVWDYDLSDVAATILQIVSIEYHLDYAILEVSSRLPQVTHRIEDINRNMVDDWTKDNPTAPS